MNSLLLSYILEFQYPNLECEKNYTAPCKSKVDAKHRIFQ